MVEVSKILKILKSTYLNARIVLNYGNNWELLAAVILSAQCTDKKVNEVTSVLFPKYKETGNRKQETMVEEKREIENFATMPLEELEKDIKSTGFYHNKAKSIQGAAKMILEKFDGKLPKTMEEMVMIPGVARKTANVVLGNAYGVVEGIAVDTHVLRLSQRLRVVDLERVGSRKRPIRFERHGSLVLDYYKDASPEKIERELMKIIAKNDWFKLTYLLIDHGRAICKAQKPDCKNCQVNKLCQASRAF
jgi:endonuclease-3